MVPGSLASDGQTTVGVSKVTRSILKRLAGDTPVSTYVRDLAISLDSKNGGIPLPGMERAASENTTAAISSKLNVLTKSLLEFAEFSRALDKKVDMLLSKATGGRIGLAGVDGQQSALIEDTISAINPLVSAANKLNKDILTDNNEKLRGMLPSP